MQKKEFDILVELTQEKESLTQREIAEKTKLSLGTVNKTMKALCEAGYIADGCYT